MLRKSQLIVALFAMMVMTTHAYAQNQYYVSPSGSGTACSQSTPCATLAQAQSTAVVGASGAQINVAAGTYALGGGGSDALPLSKSGTSDAARMAWQCATRGACHITATVTGNVQIVFITASFLTFDGFDVTNVSGVNPNNNGGITIVGGSHDIISHNTVHDIQPTCTQNGGQGIGQGTGSFNTFDSNVVRNIGQLNSACNTANTVHGINIEPNGTVAGTIKITNNIVSNANGGWCLQVQGGGSSGSSFIIANNLLFHCGNGGMVFNQQAVVFDFATVINNIVLDNGTKQSKNGIYEFAVTGTHNKYANNDVFGNAGVNYSFNTGSQTGGISVDPSLNTTFVNWQLDGSGDYHPKSGSPLVGAGTITCASGTSICVPSTDFAGVTRPNPPSIGAYELNIVASFSPSALSFGTVPVSTSSAVQQSTLTNTGTSSLTISSKTISGTNAGDFSSSDTCPGTLSPGASCLFSVTFTPQAAGARSANVTVNDNGVGSPHQLPLSGTGGSSQWTVSPTSLSFGVVAIGSCSAVQLSTFSNTGSVAVTIGSSTIGGTNPGDFAFGGLGTCGNGQTYQPGGSCTDSIKFCPTAAGARSGTDTQPSNAANSPTVLSFTGTGGAPVVSLTPSSASCGSAQVGTSTTCQIFTLQNTGNANLTSIVVSLTGANPASYAQSNSCPATLAAAASCSITVFFQPATTGVQTANLSIASNASTSPNTVGLTGTGSPPPSISLVPATVNFGSVNVGTTSAPSTITITNTGGATANLSSIVASSGFAITSNTCGSTLAPNVSCQVGVTASPTSTGVTSGTLTVTDSAPGSPQVASLTVTGTTPAVALTPASNAYGNQAVGTATVPFNFTFTNSGTGPVSINSVGIVGANPSDFLISTNSCGASPTLSDTFSSGTLDSSKWVIDTGNSPAPGAGNTGTFSTANVFLNQNVLDLMLTQVAGSPIVSTGAEVRSLNTFGYGTYTWIARAGSTAATPSGSGSAVSGQVTGIFNYFQNNGLTAPNFTEDDFEVEGQFPTQLEMTSWSSASPKVNTETNFTATGMDAGFHQYTYIWAPGRIDYYFDGALVSTHTTNVPSSPGFVIQNFYGTNGSSFGGTATTGVTRHLYVSSFSYTPTAATLGAGSSCTVGITFKPIVSGARSATLQFIDSASGSPHISTLTGTGTSLSVSLSPTSLTFSGQIINTTSSGQTVTLQNTGNITLNISSIVASGDFARTTTCGATLAPAATCTANVTFTPTALGTRTGSLTFTDNASGSPQTVPLSGTGLSAPAPIATISPSSLTFPSTTVGVASAAQVVTLQNTGNATLNISATATTGDYSRTTTCGATLATAASCTVSVTFTPTAAGTRNGTLSFTDDASGSPQAVTLTGTGIAAIPVANISPSSLTFPSTTVGVTSAAQVVTLQNTGNATLNLASKTVSGDFAISASTCGSTLAATVSCTVSVTFTPTTTGARSGTLTFTDDASGSPQTVPLTGTGTAPTAPIASISPSSLTFPSTTVGVTSAAQAVTLQNTGNATLNITSITPSGDFAVSSTTCGSTLAATVSCTINVTFTPTATGVRSGSLTFVDNAAGSPQAVALSGTGTAPAAPFATISPSSLAFGSIVVGVTSTAQVVTLQNTGNATLNITSIAATGDFAKSATTCGSTLAASASCTINVTFTPTAVGARSGALTFVDNASGSPQAIPLTGTGIAPTPVATISPTSLTFGSTTVGGTSPSQPVTLQNTGNATLSITSITPSGDFAVSSTTCGSTLAAAASCTINVTFTPTATGTRSGALTFIDNANGSPQAVSLTGTGTAPLFPVVSLSPTSLDFGNQVLSTSSSAQVVTLTNTGTATLTMTRSISGDFSISATTCGATLAATASCTVSVTFTPTALGTRTGNLTFTDNASGSPQNVPLSGFGVPAPQPAATLSPTSLTFGSQIIGTTSSAQIITLTNSGNATLNIASITAGGDFARTTTCGSALTASSNCTVNVTFTPTALGTRSGSISFVDDAAGSPQVIPLTGSGVSAPAPQASFSPTSLTFGSTTVGVTSAAQVLTLTNTGNATLNIASILASGDYARSTTCGATLAAGTNCTVSVTFTPTATGTRSGSIAFTDDANGSPQSIPLTGTGIAPTAPLVSFSPTSLTFAGQAVGTTSTAQGLTLTNTGNATLSITSAVVSGDYAIGNTTCGSTLTASSSCVFNITFTPTATGTRSGALVSTDNANGSPHSVQFTGTGTAPLIPIAQISPTSLTFANQVVNTTSAAQTITLTNTGNGTLNITSIVASGDFARSTTCGLTLAPSVSCTVSVTFTPTAQGTRNGNIAFTDNASGSPQNAALTGTGVPAPQPAVTLSPTSLTFPSTFVGSTTAAQDITLTNSGTATLNIASIVASGDYSRTTTCGSTLATSSSCVIHVTFTPTAPGTRAGLISITDNAPGSPQTVSLSGVGIATSPAVCLSRTSINFGNQPVGSSSSSMSATVTDCGTANLIISGITVSGDYSQTNNCTTLAPNTTCTVNGVFSPTVAGTRTGSFSIASNAASSPDMISLTGFGTQTGAAISPTSISFGSAIVGQNSASVPITVQNTGNTSLSLATPTISGTNVSDYSSGACFPTLAANASCSYLAVFSPLAPGSRTATLNQSITGIPSLTVALSGTGVAAASGVTTTPASLDFGSVTIGVTSGSKTVQIQNSGNVVLNITSVTLTGTNAADYSLVNHCGAALAVGGICTADVTATPSGTGARTANLHLIDDALTSPQNVPLTTNGVAVPAPTVSLAPTSLAFSPPSVQTGTTSQALTVTARNTGNANLVVTHPVTLGGSNPGDYTVSDNCGTVTPGNSCTATVNCAPTAAGSRPATVIFTSNAASSPDSATLACTGFVGTPTLTLAVSTINFGNQTVGTTSGQAVFTLTNTGLATATGVVITATGDFAVSNTCGGSIAQNTSCSANVTFTPVILCGQFDSGGSCTSNVHLGQVSVVSNTSNSPQTVALQGTAVPAPPPPGPIIVGVGGKAKTGGKATVGVH